MVTSDLGACEWFVWDLRRSGLIDRGQLDSIVSDFLKRNPRAEAPGLAEYLVEQGILTAFQAERILNGKTQGLVLGPYVLLDAIGSGSMGQVYKASSKNDGILYAVKVLPRRSMWNVRLARRQVRSFGQFSHPAVVPFVDVGTAGGLHYLVWPLVEGATLEGLVQENGKLPINQAVLYTIQVAQGLTVAHQNALFHGLLKPSNIMIGPDNQARLLDFGIGSLLVENEGESLVDTMSTANTLTSGLDCAAPESIMDPTNRTPAGDQYSLGCVLYYCLTGRVPFPEGSAVEKMMAHQTKEPIPVKELSSEVPDALIAVVKRLMGKKAEDRFSGCDELVEALEPFLGDVNAVPGGVPNNTPDWNRGSGPNRAVGGLPGSHYSHPGLPPASHPGSAGKLPSLPSRPGGSHPGTAGLPGSHPGSHPGTRPPGSHPGTKTAPPGSHPGARPQSNHGAKLPPATPPGVRTQTPPGRNSPNLPSRSSFQLPPMAEEIDAPPVSAHGRPPAGWTDDEPDGRKGGFGPIGLVAAALLLMVAVYLGATLLMPK